MICGSRGWILLPPIELRNGVIAYWTLYLAPIAWGIASGRSDRLTQLFARSILALLIFVLVGLRRDTGCDWYAYVDMYDSMDGVEPLESLFLTGDIAYSFLNWLSYSLELEIYFVNAVCAAILTAGLFSFSERQPYPWMVLSLAAGYTLTVVAMGYTRQATAVGALMLAMNAYGDRNVRRFLLYVVLAALFHRSALVFAPLSLVIHRWSSLTPRLIAAGVVLSIGAFLLLDSSDGFIQSYVTSAMESEGGLVRSLVNFCAAVTCLLFRGKFAQRFSDWDLYLVLSLVALVAVPLVLLAPAGVDRLGLYLLPWQIAVFARVPVLLDGTPFRIPGQVAILGAYGLMLYVWLNHSTHAPLCWIPYRNLLWD